MLPRSSALRWRNTALLPLDLLRNAPRAKARGHALQSAPAAGGHAAGLACSPCSPVCIVTRHGARRGAPVRRAAQPLARRARALPGAAGRRWAAAGASRCQAPGPSPGARGGCVRSRVGAARCSCSPLHAFSAASALLALWRHSRAGSLAADARGRDACHGAGMCGAGFAAPPAMPCLALCARVAFSSDTCAESRARRPWGFCSAPANPHKAAAARCGQRLRADGAWC